MNIIINYFNVRTLYLVLVWIITVMNVRVLYNSGTLSQGEKSLASEEGLCSIELVGLIN